MPVLSIGDVTDSHFDVEACQCRFLGLAFVQPRCSTCSEAVPM